MPFWRDGEVDEWRSFLQVAGIIHKNIQRDMFFSLKDLIDRYGDDGMGDKPADVSRITYWAQHLNLDTFTKRQAEATAADEKRQRRKATRSKKNAPVASGAGELATGGTSSAPDAAAVVEDMLQRRLSRAA